jgi:thiosulfate/3-mercaptopyruvate sulfurtransferase
VLNGGTTGWITEGREVVSAAAKTAEGNWVSKADRSAEMLADAADVEKAVAAKTQLIDARDNATFLGLAKPGSVSAFGHVHGAKNVPTTLMSTQGGEAARLMSADTYRDIFKMSGADSQAETIAYCNTGHQASGTWFVLHEVLGNKQTKLYDGSMHEWAQTKRPMESVAREAKPAAVAQAK